MSTACPRSHRREAVAVNPSKRRRRPSSRPSAPPPPPCWWIDQSIRKPGGRMGRLLEYFLVCGLGPDLQSTDIPPDRGYFGTSVYYAPALLDQFPPSDIADCPDPPPQLPLVSPSSAPPSSPSRASILAFRVCLPVMIFLVMCWFAVCPAWRSATVFARSKLAGSQQPSSQLPYRAHWYEPASVLPSIVLVTCQHGNLISLGFVWPF